MNRIDVPVSAALIAFVTPGALSQVVDLAGTADPSSSLAEVFVTGSVAQIGFGDGGSGDLDGLYDINDPSVLFGSGLDIFPSETAFSVGNLSYDAASVTGTGTQTAAVTGIDLSGLWDGTAAADISATAMSNWFLTAPIDFVFGGLDAADTVTFHDGQLVSIDLEVSASFVVDYTFGFGPATWYDGTFSVSSNQFSLSIDALVFDVETAQGVLPASQFLADINGTVAAVVPGPGAAAVLVGGLSLAVRRRRDV